MSGKEIRRKKDEKGFTLIELLVVAAIIGILLAIAIPNLMKARISANEANARKSMQTLRDAEGEYFEQDLDDNGTRDFTNLIGDVDTPGTLRGPDGSGLEEDALVDITFEGADTEGSGTADCERPKAGYCIQFDADNVAANETTNLYDDFGWQASMSSYNKTGRRDFSVYGDGVIRCGAPLVDGEPGDTGYVTNDPGTFQAVRESPGCN